MTDFEKDGTENIEELKSRIEELENKVEFIFERKGLQELYDE